MECVPWKKEIAEMGPLSQVGQTGSVCFPMEDAEYPMNHKIQISLMYRYARN